MGCCLIVLSERKPTKKARVQSKTQIDTNFGPGLCERLNDSAPTNQNTIDLFQRDVLGSTIVARPRATTRSNSPSRPHLTQLKQCWKHDTIQAFSRHELIDVSFAFDLQ